MNPTLREAHSTPYIRSEEESTQPRMSSANSVDEKENSRGSAATLNGESMTEFNKDKVHFNAGCSSSSSDLTKFMEFYNDSADPDVVEEWMHIYQQQRQPPVHQRSTDSEEHRRSHTNLYSESSQESLPHCQSENARNEAKNPTESEPGMQKRSVNRSMDVLPTINEGFYTLEKCVSVEFPPKLLIPPSRLCRSKEMPNIADVDDYE